MADIVQLTGDTTGLVHEMDLGLLALTRVGAKLVDLDTTLAKTSRTGTRNSTLLRNAFVEASAGIVSAVTAQTLALEKSSLGIVTAIATQTASLHVMVEGLVNDLTVSKTAIAANSAAMKVAAVEANSLTGSLARTHVATGTLSGSFKNLLLDGNNLHSMSRGLASGFGLMFLTWGNMVPLLAGAALSMGFAQALKLGTQVADNLTDLRVLAGATAEEMVKIGAAITRIGESSKFGPEQTTLALKSLMLAGLSAEDALKNLSTVLNFSTLSGTGKEDLKALEKSAETLIAISTAFGYGANGMSTVADVIAKTAAVSMATIEGMTESFRTASVVAQQYGVSLNDTALNLAFLSQMGIKGTMAGTAMTNMYQQLMGGSKQAQKELKILGLTMIDTSTNAAKPLLTFFEELSVKLAKMNATDQQLVLSRISTNRGLRDMSAVLAALRNTTETLDPVTTKQIANLRALGKETEASTLQAESSISTFARLNKLLEDAPGFAAISAAEKSLAPGQQWGAVQSALGTGLNAAFAQVQDTLYIVGAELRQVFNSPEFHSALASIVSGVTSFIEKLIDGVAWLTKNAEALRLMGTHLLTLVAGVGTVITVFTALSVGFGTMAGVLATVEVGLWGITGAMAAVGAASIKLLTTPAGWIALAAGVAAAGVAYYVMGGFVTEAEKKAKAAEESAAERAKADRLRSVDFRASIEASIKGYEDRAEAARTGVAAEIIASERGAEAEKLRIEGVKDETVARQKLSLIKDQTTLAGLSPVSDEARILRGVIAAKQQDMAVTIIQAAVDKVTLDARIGKLKELAAAEKVRVEAGVKRPPFDPNASDIPDPGKDRLQSLHAAHDKELQDIKTFTTQRLSLVTQEANNETKILKAQQDARVITQGSYQVQEIGVIANAEEQKALVYRESYLSYHTEVAKRLDDLDLEVKAVIDHNSTIKGGAEKVTEILKKATADRVAIIKDQQAYDNTYYINLQKLQDDARTRIELQALAFKKAYNVAQKASDDYYRSLAENEAKANRQTGTEDQLRFASPLDAAKINAAASAFEQYNSVVLNFDHKISDLSKSYAEALVILDGATTLEATMGIGNGLEEQQQQVAGINKELEHQKTLRKDLLDLMPGKLEDAANRAGIKFIKDSNAAFSNGLADSIETAVFDGGKAGGDKLWKVLQDEFLRKPLRVALQGVMGSVVGSVLGGATGATGGVGTALGAASGASSVYNSAIAGGSLYTGMASAYTAATTGASVLATEMGVVSSSMVGVNAALSTTLAGIPIYGWIALAAIAIFSSKGKDVPKSEGGYAPNGMNISGLDALGNQQGSQRGEVATAQLISSSIVLGYQTVAQQLGIKNGKIDVGVFYAQDPTGDSQTQLQIIGGAYNRSDTMGGIENAGKTSGELQDAIAKSAAQLILVNLQASDLPSYLQQVFTGLSVNTATTQQINDAIAFATSLKQIYTSLTETRTPLQVLADDLTSFGTSTATFKADFQAAIEAGMNPADLTAWQNLGAEIDAVNALIAKTNDLHLTEAQLMGNTAGAAEYLKIKREAEYATMSDGDAAIQRRIDQLKDEKDATAALLKTNDLRLTEAQLMGDTASAAEYLKIKREAEYKALGDINGPIQKRIDLLNDEKAATAALLVTNDLRLTEAQLMKDTAGVAEFLKIKREAEYAAMTPGDAAIQRHIDQLNDQAAAADAAATALANMSASIATAGEAFVHLGLKTTYEVAQQTAQTAWDSYRGTFKGTAAENMTVAQVATYISDATNQPGGTNSVLNDNQWKAANTFVTAYNTWATAEETARAATDAAATKAAQEYAKALADLATLMATNTDLQGQIDVLTGMHTQTEVDRAKTMADIMSKLGTTTDQTTVSLQNQLWAQQDLAAAAKVTSDYNRAMLTAKGNTSELAAFDRVIADAALITAGWSQEQVNAVHAAEATTAAAKVTTDFNRAMLDATGSTSGLAAYDKAIADAALITAGWTQAQIDQVDAAKAITAGAKVTSDFNRAMLNAAGDTSGLAKFDKAVADAALITAGWSQAQVDAVNLTQGQTTAQTARDTFLEKFDPISAGQKISDAQGYIGKVLKSVGLSINMTAYQVGEYIKTLDPATAAGQALITTLTDLTASFDTTTTAAITVAKSDLTAAYQKEYTALQDMITKMGSFVTSLRSFKDSLSLGSLSPLTPEQKYTEARAQYEAILAATQSPDQKTADAAQGKLQDAATAFLTASEVANAHDVQYQADFAHVQSTIGETISWAEQQVTLARSSLIALDAQVTGLIAINTSVLSVVDAIAALTLAMGTNGTVSNPQTSGLTALYSAILGRAPDTAGLAFWQGQMNQGQSLAQISALMFGSSEYINGSHANGLLSVPYDGYRAELHKHERVLTARESLDYSNMGTLNMSPLVAEIKMLREEVATLRSEQGQQTGAIITSNYDANDRAAEKVATSNVDAAKTKAWVSKSEAKIV